MAVGADETCLGAANITDSPALWTCLKKPFLRTYKRAGAFTSAKQLNDISWTDMANGQNMANDVANIARVQHNIGASLGP